MIKEVADHRRPVLEESCLLQLAPAFAVKLNHERIGSRIRWIATTIPRQPGLLSRSWLRARASPLR